MLFEKNNRIVFTGDSVTDDGRARPVGEGNGLGNGYVALIDAFLSVDRPDLNLRIFNTGLSGNTSKDLLDRWDSDVNALSPDHVVVMIGINDVWRQFDMPQCVDRAVLPDEYENNLNAIADKTTAKLIFMSPFYMETNKSDAMRRRTDEYAAICKKVAAARNIPFVDVQAAFDEYLKHRYPAFVSWDRVHPGRYGSVVIARAFLNAVGHKL